MARGKQVYLSYTALVLLGYALQASADDLWTVDIDMSPAPPPDQGPPFSAHALRNTKYLPYEILGIVGSYFVAILFIGTLLLSCGQRARKRAQMLASNQMTSQEMVRPNKLHFSPVSPYGQDARKSAMTSVRSINSARSPGGESAVSFDANTIEADRRQRADEMEKLYAAVMAQEEQRLQSSTSNMQTYGNPPEYSHTTPYTTDVNRLQHEQYPTTPKSPVRAIYPPDRALVPQGRTYSVSGDYSNHSFGSGEQSAAPSTNSSPQKKTRKALKNLKISAPMRISDNDDGARTPLSPRIYTDPGIPPEPPTARTMDSAWPTTPGTIRSYVQDDDWDYAQTEEKDMVTDMPVLDSQVRGKGRQNFSQPLRLQVPQPINTSAASTTNTLPLRQVHWNSPTSPMYANQSQAPFSAGPTKTTFVEVRRERLGAAPLTGMATPYSAYMPFTPLTPVTPHLTTRAERRQREREQRTIRGAITEEDQVIDDKELWGESY